MVKPEKECKFFRAKGMHLYLGYRVKATGYVGAACYGCGKER